MLLYNNASIQLLQIADKMGENLLKSMVLFPLARQENRYDQGLHSAHARAQQDKTRPRNPQKN